MVAVSLHDNGDPWTYSTMGITPSWRQKWLPPLLLSKTTIGIPARAFHLTSSFIVAAFWRIKGTLLCCARAKKEMFCFTKLPQQLIDSILDFSINDSHFLKASSLVSYSLLRQPHPDNSRHFHRFHHMCLACSKVFTLIEHCCLRPQDSRAALSPRTFECLDFHCVAHPACSPSLPDLAPAFTPSSVIGSLEQSKQPAPHVILQCVMSIGVMAEFTRQRSTINLERACRAFCFVAVAAGGRRIQYHCGLPSPPYRVNMNRE
ncbi:hypothetical protein EDD18DRAFT_63912 [Armillaria luteobubalina]|uniref:Uncharacterized protein n=1 Tax=Armillaria luteobubalina TaxID=153913 RepID=A0AA39QA80_9AGAR|nr:hypothetical protein EDD18DRAFT_63912 [Armillaria luteobubalina]